MRHIYRRRTNGLKEHKDRTPMSPEERIAAMKGLKEELSRTRSSRGSGIMKSEEGKGGGTSEKQLQTPLPLPLIRENLQALSSIGDDQTPARATRHACLNISSSSSGTESTTNQSHHGEFARRDSQNTPTSPSQPHSQVPDTITEPHPSDHIVPTRDPRTSLNAILARSNINKGRTQTTPANAPLSTYQGPRHASQPPSDNITIEDTHTEDEDPEVSVPSQASHTSLASPDLSTGSTNSVAICPHPQPEASRADPPPAHSSSSRAGAANDTSTASTSEENPHKIEVTPPTGTGSEIEPRPFLTPPYRDVCQSDPGYGVRELGPTRTPI